VCAEHARRHIRPAWEGSEGRMHRGWTGASQGTGACCKGLLCPHLAEELVAGANVVEEELLIPIVVQVSRDVTVRTRVASASSAGATSPKPPASSPHPPTPEPWRRLWPGPSFWNRRCGPCSRTEARKSAKALAPGHCPEQSAGCTELILHFFGALRRTPGTAWGASEGPSLSTSESYSRT